MKIPAVLPLYILALCVMSCCVSGLFINTKGDPVREVDDFVEQVMDEPEEDPGILENIEEAVDPCPGDWSYFEGFCYHVNGSLLTRRQARSYCRSLGGDLVKITSAEENNYVLYLARKFARKVKRVWLGLYWDGSSKDYYWIDHSVPEYTNWAPDEPSGFAQEPCAQMYTSEYSDLPNRASGYWNDISCVKENKYGTVCKKLA